MTIRRRWRECRHQHGSQRQPPGLAARSETLMAHRPITMSRECAEKLRIGGSTAEWSPPFTNKSLISISLVVRNSFNRNDLGEECAETRRFAALFRPRIEHRHADIRDPREAPCGEHQRKICSCAAAGVSEGTLRSLRRPRGASRRWWVWRCLRRRRRPGPRVARARAS